MFFRAMREDIPPYSSEILRGGIKKVRKEDGRGIFPCCRVTEFLAGVNIYNGLFCGRPTLRGNDEGVDSFFLTTTKKFFLSRKGTFTSHIFSTSA